MKPPSAVKIAASLLRLFEKGSEPQSPTGSYDRRPGYPGPDRQSLNPGSGDEHRQQTRPYRDRTSLPGNGSIQAEEALPPLRNAAPPRMKEGGDFPPTSLLSAVLESRRQKRKSRLLALYATLPSHRMTSGTDPAPVPPNPVHPNHRSIRKSSRGVCSRIHQAASLLSVLSVVAVWRKLHRKITGRHSAKRHTPVT